MEMLTFQAQMARLAAAFSTEPSAARLEVYFEELGDLPDAVFVQVCTRAVGEWDKPYTLPPIAVLLRYAKEIAVAEGSRLDGAAAWEACERRVFRQWSETGDRLIASTGRGYDWPDARSRDVLRNRMGVTVREVVHMHPREYTAMRDRFNALYDQGEAVEEARRELLPPGNVRQIASGT